MMEGKKMLQGNNEENYLNFLLSIEDEESFSMLNCLLTFMKKFRIVNIDALASFVFKLVNFMD